MNFNEVLQFLSELKRNNNKEWFNHNKKNYESARYAIIAFVTEIIGHLSVSDEEIKKVSAKDCLFRINRDLRFSTDKSPYKTNFGAFVSKGGRKGLYSGYYLHFEPGSCFLAGGIYMPSADVIKAIRNEIYFCYDEFNRIVSKKSFIKLFHKLSGESLINPPKEFPADHPGIEYLKLKSFIVMHNVDDKTVLKNNYFNYAIEVLEEMKSLNNFLNRAVDNKIR